LSPRLAILDGLNRVIRIVSFSKTLSASMRCGYIAGRSDWIEGLIDLQIATHFAGPSSIATELIAGVLAGCRGTCSAFRNPQHRSSASTSPKWRMIAFFRS
jgi:DNA-binding transcriptional MocR family regulator